MEKPTHETSALDSVKRLHVMDPSVKDLVRSNTRHSNDTSTTRVRIVFDDGGKLAFAKNEHPTFHSTVDPCNVATRSGLWGQATRAIREYKIQLQGWRFGVAVSAFSASTVLAINLFLTVAVAAIFHDSIEDGIATVYIGNCDSVDKMTTSLHVVINVLSSMLLSASNYTMQVVCAPTRAEVDRAHAKGDWLDIGVLSVRNIRGRISRQRALVWWLLALSSIPIHLIYNSAVFKTLDTNDYSVLVVTEDFLKGEPFSFSVQHGLDPPELSLRHPRLSNVQEIFAKNYKNSSIIQNLTNADCIRKYGMEYLSGRSNVLLITRTKTGDANNMTFYYSFDERPNSQRLTYGWICDGGYPYGLRGAHCDVGKAIQKAEDWSAGSHQVDYCLSQLEEPNCKMQFSLDILAAVIMLNAIKTACMLWTSWKRRSPPLVTLGDAVASFLIEPDRLTEGRCLMAKSDLEKQRPRWSSTGLFMSIRPLPQTIELSSRHWFTSASARRWVYTLSLCGFTLLTAALLLGHGASKVSRYADGKSVFNLGFGTVDPREIVQIPLPHRGTTGLVASVLLANLPQTIVSFVYLSYNGLLTSMLLSFEWSGYYLRKKPLRVTTPRGKQRSKYYLHLPYMYSVPLVAASATLHWLLSESIFLVRIDEYEDGSLARSLSQVGFSCLPILVIIILGTIMVAMLIGTSFRKFAVCMPVAGSCSAAISAACHRPSKDTDAAYLPISWGAIENDGETSLSHCCFTSLDVRAPTHERLYA